MVFGMWILELQTTGLVTERLKNTRDLKTLGFVEINDDITHPITQIGKVPLSMQDG